MLKKLPFLVLLLLVALQAHADNKPVYVNTGELWSQPGQSLPKVIMDIPVPANAIGIVSWQFASECPKRDPLIRVGIRLKVNGEMINHWATRKVEQSEIRTPGGDYTPLQPGDSVQMFAFVRNEDVESLPIKANIWVWFKLQED